MVSATAAELFSAREFDRTASRSEPVAVTTPTITVLTATHNRADKLRRLYESLTLQTYTDFEWLVVDDGSGDDTADVVAALIAEASFPARYIYQENRGRHVALNVGVREAVGGFCAVIDDDDWYAPDGLERLMFHWNALPDKERFAEVQGLCLSAAEESRRNEIPGAGRRFRLLRADPGYSTSEARQTWRRENRRPPSVSISGAIRGLVPRRADRLEPHQCLVRGIRGHQRGHRVQGVPRLGNLEYQQSTPCDALQPAAAVLPRASRHEA